MPTLSILIPTLPARKPVFSSLMNYLHMQLALFDAFQDVEILIDPRGSEITTGAKRNDLVQRARGTYITHLDCDDIYFEGSIGRILGACRTGADCIGINGLYTCGVKKVPFEIRLNNPYEAQFRAGQEVYLRHPNHIAPMKREIAMKIAYPDKTAGEDYEFACALKASGLLKTEVVIEEPIYWYRK